MFREFTHKSFSSFHDGHFPFPLHFDAPEYSQATRLSGVALENPIIRSRNGVHEMSKCM
jgi:hypothetical protein